MNNLSLRLRITLITSVLLIFISIAFTIFGLYNLSVNVIDPLQLNLEVDMYSFSRVDAVVLNDFVGNLDKIIIQDRVEPYSRFSIFFMVTLIIIATGIMYILSGIALKPAKKLAKNINMIDRTTLSYRIEDFNAGDELDSIANSFNFMLDRLELAFQREERFSAAAAHELKTPITIIKTNLDVYDLYGSYEKEDVDEFVEVVREQTFRMVSLVNDLTSWCSQEDYQKEQLIKLDSLLREISYELEDLIKEKKVNLDFNLESCEFMGNYIMLKHAFSNIINNGIKYNKPGGSLSLGLKADKSKIIVEVKDSGIGIEEKDLKNIFEPFYRADKSRSRKLAGSGLGLAITRDIIESHEGDIFCKSKLGEGTEFIITL